MTTRFPVGTRVKFTNRRGGVTFGTVQRNNPKTVTLTNCSDSARGWKVRPWALRAVEAGDNDPGAAAAPARNEAADRAVFDAHAPSFGLTGAFGKVFALRGTQYRVVGLSPNRPRYPVNCERVRDGKPFKVPAEDVKRALGNTSGSRPSLTPLIPTPTPPLFRIGDKVTFRNKGRTLGGTVKRVNRKTISITPDAPEYPGQYWLVSPSLLRKVA